LLSSLQQVNNCFCKYFILFFYEFALSISCVTSPFLGKMRENGKGNGGMRGEMGSHLDRLSENVAGK